MLTFWVSIVRNRIFNFNIVTDSHNGIYATVRRCHRIFFAPN